MKQNEAEFSTIRSFLWPIHGHELKKFLPMLLLFFLISFNYHLLRIAKDALIITAPDSGAETIPFLKVWAVLPAAIIITLFYTRLANHFRRENIFYVMIGFFLTFFVLFIFVLYPHQQQLNLDNFANYLQNWLPKGCNGLILIIRYWVFTLFYVMSESWSNIMVSLLLWGFANDVITVTESKRFYALFGLGTNSSGILAGKVGLYFSGVSASSNNLNSWDYTLNLFIISVLICGLTSIFLYRWLQVNVFKNHYQAQNPTIEDIANKKDKATLCNSLSYIKNSPYLLSIAIIVLAYNLTINLTEVLWKSQIKELYPNSNEYSAFMSQVTFYVGIIATLTAYFISGNVIRRLGWKFSAMITPAIFAFTGLGFFYFLFFKKIASGPTSMTILGMTPLALTVLFGTLQNCLSRAAKYTVFDDTKEMALIPLSSEARFKGKAAIDGIGSRLGKSGGSILLQGLLMIFSTPAACAPYIAAIISGTLFIWGSGISFLSNAFEQFSRKIPAEEPEEKAS